MATRPPTRARRRTRGVALVAYLAAITCLPLLHAGTEVLRSETSVEAGHTQACPVLHGGHECTIATSVHDALLARTSVRAGLAPDAPAVAPPRATPNTARHRVRQNAVRAPPIV